MNDWDLPVTLLSSKEWMDFDFWESCLVEDYEYDFDLDSDEC